MLAHQDISQPKVKLSNADYRQQITVARITLVDDQAAAINLLKSLTESNPRLPDAYLLLADACKETNPEESIKYYTALLTHCPDYVGVINKRGSLYYKMGKKTEFASDVALAKLYNLVDKILTTNYHQQLRECLYTIDDLSMLSLVQENTLQGFDDSDPKLSNGASEYACLTSKCAERHDHELTIYFAEEAVSRFPNDIYSASARAYTLFFVKRGEEALKELEEQIEKYDYARCYYYRADIYRRLGQHALAKQDIIKFLTAAHKGQIEHVLTQALIPKFLEIINAPDAEDAQALTDNDKLDLEIELGKLRLIAKNIPDEETVGKNIQHIKQLLRQFPATTELYYILGYLNDSISESRAAVQAYSVAIWLEDDAEKLARMYTLRATLNLYLGEPKTANKDIDWAIKFTQLSKPKTAELEIKKLKRDFAEKCLETGKVHLENKNYWIAANIFDAGIGRQPSCELYIEFAGVQASFGNYNLAYKILVEDASAQAVLIPKNQRAYGTKISNKIASLVAEYQTKLIQEQNVLSKAVNKTPPPAKKLRIEAEEEKTEPEKKKNKKPKPKAVKPKTNTGSSHNLINTVLNAEEVAERTALAAIAKAERLREKVEEAAELAAFKQQQAEEKAAQEKQKREEANKRDENRREKRKQKKAKKHAASAPRIKSEKPVAEDTVAEEKAYVPVTPPESINRFNLFADLPGIAKVTVPLLDLEKEIMEKLSGKNHDCRLVGSGAAYRIRSALTGKPPMDSVLKKIDDIDLVTNRPIAEIAALFPEAKLKYLPGTQGVFSMTINGIKIDIAYTNDIEKHMRKCDFFCVWLNKKGDAFDPTGRQFNDLRNGILPCARKDITNLFVEDPVRILRAIYTANKDMANKGDFKIPERIQKRMNTDKTLLVPGSSTLAPARLNFWIRKILSKGEPAANYNSMRELGLLQILFPPSHEDLEHEWMLQQIEKSKTLANQTLEFFYASLIIARLVPELDMTRPTIALQASCRRRCQAAIAESPLFKTAAMPGNGAEFDELFQNVIRNWQVFHADKLEKTESLDHSHSLKP